VNSTIFEMALMDAWQWVIVAMFAAVTFIVMEIEKAARRYLCSLGEDTDDMEYNEHFDASQPSHKTMTIPQTHLRDELHK
jgi:hypothetical protein